MKYVVFEPDTMIPHEFNTQQECNDFLLNYYTENKEKLEKWRKRDS